MLRRGVPFIQMAGTFAIVLGLSKVHADAIGQYDLTESSRFVWALAYIGSLCTAAYAVGLPDLGGRDSLRLAAAATGATAVGVSLTALALGSALLPRFVVFGSIPALIIWYTACALVVSGSRERQAARFRVVAIVDDDEGAALRQEVQSAATRPVEVAAILAPRAATAEGDRRPVIEAVEATSASLIVLDRAAQADPSIVSQAAELHARGLRVRTMSLFYDEFLGKLPVAELEQISLMFDIGEIHRLHYLRLKRVADLLIAGPAMVLLALLTPPVLLGNLLANRGPLMYRQPRVGKNGRPFEIWKFRTMTAGSSTGDWTSVDDPRVTPFGRWLRRTHVDEFPQLVNILRGDLSVVGPRPEQPHYVEQLEAKIPFYGYRHLVRPGLTGWAQVSLEYGRSEFDALEKLQYEFYYLRHQGLALDARIIVRTLRSVIRLGGA